MAERKLKPGWRRVKFGYVVQLSKARCADPLAEGVECYVGLEHLEPGDLCIRSWGSVVDAVTFTTGSCCANTYGNNSQADLTELAMSLPTSVFSSNNDFHFTHVPKVWYASSHN